MKRTSVILDTILSTVVALFAGSCQEEGHFYENMVSSVTLHTLNLSQYEVDCPSPQGMDFIVNVSSTYTDWEFADIPDWITVTPKSGGGDAEVRIAVGSNDKAQNRLGVLSFRSTNSDWHYSAAFTVSQYRAPYTIYVENNTLDLEGAAGTANVRVYSNTDTWTAIVPAAMDWCTVQKKDNGIAISVTDNKGNASRSGIIELHTDDASEFVTVTQRPAGVKSTTERVDFPVEGGMSSFTIDPETAWSIETTYYWIRVSPSEGEAGTRNLILEVNANYSLSPRNGYIYVVISDDNKIEIPVHQAGIELSVSKDTLTVPSSGETCQLAVNSNLDWKFVDSIPDWISVDPTIGNGNTQVIVKVNLNNDPVGREAKLWLAPAASDYRVPLLVKQNGRVFGADSTSIRFSDQAGTTWFNIKSNGLLWLVNTADNWITLSPEYGTESARITVSVTENTGDSIRVGNIMVVTAGQKENVQVIQTGKFMEISSKALEFGSNGGSSVVSISTSGHWTASASESWIILSAVEGDGNGNITISVQDNPSLTDREGEVTITRNGSTNPIRISVSQTARYLTVSTDSIQFFESGGTSDPVIVQTDGTYDVETSFGWLTIVRLSQSQFTVTAAENTTSVPRTGTVMVKLTDLTSGLLIREITVTQDGATDYDYVDLGLSVYWATCNVGADAPEEYGGQYSWGEITEKSSYYESNWYWSNGSKTSLTKYNSYSGYGTVDYKTVLDPEDDVAHVLWGGNWRIPTREELEELVNNCIWTWTTVNNVAGYKVTSCIPGYTDRYIFLPAAGNAWGSGYHGSAGTEASYWSSNTSVDYFSAWNLHFNPDVFSVGDEKRNPGLSVRPVLPVGSSGSVSIVLNRTMLSILEGREDTLVTTVKSNVNAIASTSYSSSDNNVATVNSSGVITAISPGTCVITASYGSAQAECRVTVTSGSAQPVAVDLGLSVRWASFNLGTDRPEGPGYYFAWGETEKKSVYNWDTYKHCDDADYRFTTKYCDNSMWGTPDNKYILDPEDDAATVMWGAGWRTPSPDEMKELIENCTWTWTTENGVEGYRITSNKTGYTDQSIFLPAAGVDGVDRQMGVGLFGHYWTNSIRGAGWVAAWKLYFNNNAVTSAANSYKMFCDNRFYGYPVRPVCPSSTYVSPVTVASIELRRNYRSVSSIALTLSDSVVIETISKNSNGTIITADVQWSSSNDNVAEVTNNGTIIARGVGTCTITAYVGEVQATCDVAVLSLPSEPTGYENGYGYVDLGLSVNWATYNVGASTPKEYGDYFAWGEIEPYYEPGYARSSNPVWKSGKSAGYDWPSYKYCEGLDSTFTKYCSFAVFGYDGFTDNKLVLDVCDDVAHVMWGDNWYIPSQEDFEELKTGCTFTWVIFGDVEGCIVQSKLNGNSIFLPATEQRSSTGKGRGTYGDYWLNSCSNATTYGYCFEVSSDMEVGSWHYFNYFRSMGLSIRPVYSTTPVASIVLSQSDIAINENETANICATPQNSNGGVIHANVQWLSSNDDVATITNEGVVTAVGVGTCTITAYVGTVQSICSVTVTDSTIPSATPEYVDLGLSVNWATFNVGANAPEEYGDYYAWGETELYYEAGYAQSYDPVWKSGKPDGYSWLSYRYGSGYDQLTKYCSYSDYGYNGYTDTKTVLDLDDDAAHVNWGGSWRMPTNAELDELCASCTWTWTTQNGVNGYVVTSNKPGYDGASIFLPAAGCRLGTDLYYVGSDGGYWSSSLRTDYSYCAWYLNFNSDGHCTMIGSRDCGYTVRAVCP